MAGRRPADFLAYDRMESLLAEADQERLGRIAPQATTRSRPSLRIRLGSILVGAGLALARGALGGSATPHVTKTASPCPEP